MGFRALKGVGWQWQHTRRTDPARVARHWLVLAVATLWVVAYGTRSEDAQTQGVPPARLRTPPALPPAGPRPSVSFAKACSGSPANSSGAGCGGLVAAPRALARAAPSTPGDVWPAMTPRLPTLVSYAERVFVYLYPFPGQLQIGPNLFVR